MKLQRAYKVQLYPNKTQEEQLMRIINACRFTYNYFLANRIGYYKEYGQTLSYKDMSRDLTRMRNSLGWLSEVQQEPIHQSLRRLDKTYRGFSQKRGASLISSQRVMVGSHFKSLLIGKCVAISYKFKGI